MNLSNDEVADICLKDSTVQVSSVPNHEMRKLRSTRQLQRKSVGDT